MIEHNFLPQTIPICWHFNDGSISSVLDHDILFFKYTISSGNFNCIGIFAHFRRIRFHEIWLHRLDSDSIINES